MPSAATMSERISDQMITAQLPPSGSAHQNGPCVMRQQHRLAHPVAHYSACNVSEDSCIIFGGFTQVARAGETAATLRATDAVQVISLGANGAIRQGPEI